MLVLGELAIELGHRSELLDLSPLGVGRQIDLRASRGGVELELLSAPRGLEGRRVLEAGAVLLAREGALDAGVDAAVLGPGATFGEGEGVARLADLRLAARGLDLEGGGLGGEPLAALSIGHPGGVAREGRVEPVVPVQSPEPEGLREGQRLELELGLADPERLASECQIRLRPPQVGPRAQQPRAVLAAEVDEGHLEDRQPEGRGGGCERRAEGVFDAGEAGPGRELLEGQRGERVGRSPDDRRRQAGLEVARVARPGGARGGQAGGGDSQREVELDRLAFSREQRARHVEGARRRLDRRLPRAARVAEAQREGELAATAGAGPGAWGRTDAERPAERADRGQRRHGDVGVEAEAEREEGRDALAQAGLGLGARQTEPLGGEALEGPLGEARDVCADEVVELARREGHTRTDDRVEEDAERGAIAAGDAEGREHLRDGAPSRRVGSPLDAERDRDGAEIDEVEGGPRDAAAEEVDDPLEQAHRGPLAWRQDALDDAVDEDDADSALGDADDALTEEGAGVLGVHAPRDLALAAGPDALPDAFIGRARRRSGGGAVVGEAAVRTESFLRKPRVAAARAGGRCFHGRKSSPRVLFPQVGLPVRIGLMDATLHPPGASPRLPSLAASLDLVTVDGFIAGRSCLLRVQVRVEPGLVEGLVLAAALSGQPVGATPPTEVAPDGSAELALTFVPALAGQHALSLRLRGRTGGDAAFEAVCDPIPVQVGDGAAPQVIHIDQSSARVIDNSRSTFGAPLGGGLLAERRWHPLRLTVAGVASPEASTGAEGADGPPRLVPPPPHRPRVVSFRVTTAAASWEARETLATGELATLFAAAGGPDGAAREAVALKIVDAQADNDLMVNEARALERLASPPEGGPTAPSPHIPGLRDRFRTGDGRIGHVLPRLEGLDLFEVRRRCPDGLPTRHVLWVLRRSLAALAHAHACGLLHGNVDPSHLIIRPRDHMLWLVDWCWAVIEPARSGDRFKAHNAVFSPPEVADRRAPLPASDLYALGKCMIFLAGGDPVAKTLPAHVEPPLERLLRWLVVESPRGRAQEATEVYREAERVREKVWGPHVFVPLDL